MMVFCMSVSLCFRYYTATERTAFLGHASDDQLKCWEANLKVLPIGSYLNHMMRFYINVNTIGQISDNVILGI